MATSQSNQIVPRRKTFWKMVKTMFLPAARFMVGCGGGKGRQVKRRLSLRNMRHAKDAFMQSTIQRPTPTADDISNYPYASSIPTTPPIIPSSPPPASELYSHDDIEILPFDHPSVALQPIDANALDENTEISTTASVSAPLPAPLNLEEAQLLLESLALRANANNLEDQRESWGERVVNVEIEQIYPEPVQEVQNPPSDNNENEENNGRNYESISAEDLERRKRISSTSTPCIDSMLSNSNHDHVEEENNAAMRRRSCTSANLSYSSFGGEGEFHGWRRSSVEVSAIPPVTLAFIPSGLCIGDRIVWVKDDHPEIGTVRWMGKIRNQFYAGIEFDKPVGNSSGMYGYGVGMQRRLFTCQLPYGRFVPVNELVLYKDYHDTGIKSGIVCIICRDDFLESWGEDACPPPNNDSNNNDDVEPSHMVSTKCGHLYHWECLDHWFSTKKRTDYHCPFCLRPMARDEVIRIFPSQI